MKKTNAAEMKECECDAVSTSVRERRKINIQNGFAIYYIEIEMCLLRDNIGISRIRTRIVEPNRLAARFRLLGQSPFDHLLRLSFKYQIPLSNSK